MLRFDGWDDRLGLTGSSEISSISLFAVLKIDFGATGPNPSNPITFGALAGGGSEYAVVIGYPPPDTIAGGSGMHTWMWAAAPGCAAYGKWRNLSIVTDQTMRITTVRVDGVNASISRGVWKFNVELSFSLGNSTGTGVGGIGGCDWIELPPGRSVSKCDIAEVIVCDRALPDSLRRTIEQYLGAKYQIPRAVVEERERTTHSN